VKRPQRSPFERRLRRWARAALYGSLALVAAATALGVRLLERPLQSSRGEEWNRVDWATLPEVQLLQDYLRIDTSEPDADELAGAEFLAARLAAAGIPATIERLAGRRANLWAVLEGEDRRAVVLHHHIDVDPVPDPGQWAFPPFAAQIDGPWLVGRGAFDMKSVGAAQLQAFVELARRGKRLRRSVILLATGSEEVGSDLGMRWILAHHPELVERFWALLTEGGVVESRVAGDVKYWGTEFAQRRYLPAVACSGSRQRLEELRRDLLARQAELTPHLVPEVATFLRAYAGSRDRAELRRSLADPAALRDDAAALADLPDHLHDLFFNEAIPGAVEADPAGGFSLPVKLLGLPGFDRAALERELLPAWLTFGVRIQVLELDPQAPPSSPLAHPVMTAIGGQLAASYPDAPRGPWIPAYAVTDARFVRPAGVPTFGFAPFPLVVSDPLRTASVNEQIALPAYVEGVRLYIALLDRLTD